MDIQALRRATAADHDAVEGSLPLMSPDLTLETYRATLSRLCGLVRGWEEIVSLAAPSEMQSMVQERARLALLESDLHQLQGECLERWNAGDGASWPVPRLLGSMYVMEGSRLGGQLIAQHVRQRFGFRPGAGAGYFEGFGPRTKTMWTEFAGLLEQIPASQEEAVIRAAQEMFRRFSSWMRAETSAFLPGEITAEQIERE